MSGCDYNSYYHPVSAFVLDQGDYSMIFYVWTVIRRDIATALVQKQSILTVY